MGWMISQNSGRKWCVWEARRILRGQFKVRGALRCHEEPFARCEGAETGVAGAAFGGLTKGFSGHAASDFRARHAESCR